ncbi:hypothetical protein PV325_008124 [Microctonus aethiopoides]|nr:hypothetical protein PV325_008124 [Microctonus aethiopoides]
MSRLLVSFVIILFVNQQVTSLNNTEISFSNIPEIFDFIEEMYKAGMNHIKSDNKLDKLKAKLDNLTEYSKIILYIEGNKKVGTGHSILFENINHINNDLYDVRSELNDHMDDVDEYHNRSMNMNTLENTKKLKMVSNAILWGRKNLPHTMFNMHKLIIPGENFVFREGLLPLMYQYVNKNYKNLCDNFISPQQWVYSIYIDIVITLLKGFITSAQTYSTRSAVDNDHYVYEYIRTKKTYIRSLMAYNQLFINYLAIFPDDIRRCNIKNPIRGGNFLTLEEYSQVLIENEADLTSTINYPTGTCKSSCKDIKNIESPHMNSSISNCEYIGGKVTLCKAPGSAYHQRLIWMKTDDNTIMYGHNDNNCKESVKEGHRRFLYYCELCLCTFQNWNTHLTISRISLSPQMADIANNMVVVGVRFVIYDKAIHLQIKQAKVSKDGFTKTPGEWKPLDIDYNNEFPVFEYTVLDPKLKDSYLNLDDVGVQPEHVVTGKLSKDHQWHKGGSYSTRKADYKRKRIEIDLSNVDDPLRTQDYYPDPESNKKVKFQQTSIKKDLGQNTVPFFDAQPNEVVPGFVLRGIGLFYRSHHGFGGFIAPRLLTHNVTSVLEKSMNQMRKKNIF